MPNAKGTTIVRLHSAFGIRHSASNELPDLYSIFRWLAFVFVTVYVTATTIQFLWSWYQFLVTPDRYINLLRNYLIVHGLRIRFRAFGGDVLVSILLSIAFLLMWRCHVHLEAIAKVQASL